MIYIHAVRPEISEKKYQTVPVVFFNAFHQRTVDDRYKYPQIRQIGQITI